LFFVYSSVCGGSFAINGSFHQQKWKVQKGVRVTEEGLQEIKKRKHGKISCIES
jgi:hypothetical protein